MNTKKIIINIVVLVLVIAILLIGWYAYSIFVLKDRGNGPDLTPSSYDTLWKDAKYTSAEGLVQSGNKKEALKSFENILLESTSTEPVVLGQIKIRIATLYDADGQKDVAIGKLFDLVNDQKEYFITRAFAYEYLARMLYQTRDQAVYGSIVSHMSTDQDLSAVNTSTDKITTLTQVLLKKSNNVAPLYLALSQKYYVETQALQGNLTDERRQIYLGYLRQNEEMISDIERDQNVGYMLPLAQLRKAEVIENIYRPGTTKQAPDVYYALAVKAYNEMPQARGYNYSYYEYARYLAVSGGGSKKAEITNLLSHYSKEVDEKTNLKTYLQNVEKEPNSKAYKDLQILKKVSGGFAL